MRHIEDGEIVAVTVLSITPSADGFIVRYQAEGIGERTALLPLPRPVGSDLIRAGRLCRLELCDNGAFILAVHPLVGRALPPR